MVTTENRVRAALAAVMDPEIPTASITDLGLVERVLVHDRIVEIDLLPTFAGCPALDAIREDVETAVRALDGTLDVRVRYVLDRPWTTDRITDAGGGALRDFGVAPPVLQIGRAPRTPCPYCGSRDTVMEGAFGPTPCRDVRYCRACRNPFEGFKPKETA